VVTAETEKLGFGGFGTMLPVYFFQSISVTHWPCPARFPHQHTERSASVTSVGLLKILGEAAAIFVTPETDRFSGYSDASLSQ
jgi:hypothetical protein